MDILHAFAGIAALVILSWACSENRRAVHWRLVASGIALQGEIAYRENQPLQYDDVELLFAALAPFEGGLATLRNTPLPATCVAGAGATLRRCRPSTLRIAQVEDLTLASMCSKPDRTLRCRESGHCRWYPLPRRSAFRPWR